MRNLTGRRSMNNGSNSAHATLPRTTAEDLRTGPLQVGGAAIMATGGIISCEPFKKRGAVRNSAPRGESTRKTTTVDPQDLTDIGCATNLQEDNSGTETGDTKSAIEPTAEDTSATAGVDDVTPKPIAGVDDKEDENIAPTRKKVGKDEESEIGTEDEQQETDTDRRATQKEDGDNESITIAASGGDHAAKREEKQTWRQTKTESPEQQEEAPAAVGQREAKGRSTEADRQYEGKESLQANAQAPTTGREEEEAKKGEPSTTTAATVGLASDGENDLSETQHMSKHNADEHSQEQEDDDWETTTHNSSDPENEQEENVSSGRPAIIRVTAGEKLKATEMRSFIETTLDQAIRKSDDTFEMGGVSRPRFYYIKDDRKKRITYIALANDSKANNQDIKYMQSGEQSLSIILNDIKTHVSENKYLGYRILIPLQQISRKHWTLLDADLSTGAITHYDSKGKIGNELANLWHSDGITFVKETLRESFPELVYKAKNTGKQSLLDDHNCGRYTLLKLLELLNPSTGIKSLKDINKIFDSQTAHNGKTSTKRILKGNSGQITSNRHPKKHPRQGIQPWIRKQRKITPTTNGTQQGDNTQKTPQKAIQATTISSSQDDRWEDASNELSAESGRKYLQQIWNNESGSIPVAEDENEEKKVVASIMNCLFERAKAKGHEFQEGTYMVEDPDQKLFNCLKELRGTYNRVSSHSMGEHMSPHYGFDINQGLFQPSDKRHVLFFSTRQSGKYRLFMKPENYGMEKWNDFAHHAIEYLESVLKRCSIIENNPTQEIHRKERTKYLPKEVQEECQACIKLITDSKIETTNDHLAGSGFLMIETPTTANKRFEKQGIGYLIQIFDKNKVTQSQEISKCLASLEESLERHGYNLNEEARVAMEVILTQEELLSP